MVGISVGLPDIMTDILCDFPQLLKTNVGLQILNRLRPSISNRSQLLMIVCPCHSTPFLYVTKYIVSFICCLYDDAVSNSVYIA
jgi:hypothetical protein